MFRFIHSCRSQGEVCDHILTFGDKALQALCKFTTTFIHSHKDFAFFMFLHNSCPRRSTSGHDLFFGFFFWLILEKQRLLAGVVPA